MPKSSWSRVGLHSERGEESIETLVTMYAGHDRIHEEQLETLRLALFPKTNSAPKKKPAARSRAKKRSAKRKR